MARTVEEKSLGTREARRKLPPQGYCYWRTIEPGLHLGYRRIRGKTGTWWARHYRGARQYTVEPLGVADDYSDSDGVVVLSWAQAQNKARERMVQRAQAADGDGGPLTVRAAVEAYLEFLESDRKSARESRYNATAFIYPALGDDEVGALTTAQLRKWHRDIANKPPRVRTKAGKEQRYREADGDEERKRSRKATANRILTTLKAALNMAFNDGKAASDTAWRRVKPFKSVDAARVRYLEIVEAKQLISACGRDFRKLVQGALQTGARYGELARMRVRDFDPRKGTITVLRSKNDRTRDIILTEEGSTLFKLWTAGRDGDEWIFRNEGRIARTAERERERCERAGTPSIGHNRPPVDDGQWHKSEQLRPMREACERAKITPPIGFHGLRHTWASHAVMNGMPLLLVALNLGHLNREGRPHTRMVERHYAHIRPSKVAEEIRAAAPRFGTVKASNGRAAIR